LREEPRIDVGILDERDKVQGRFNGVYTHDSHVLSGQFIAAAADGQAVLLLEQSGAIVARGSALLFEATRGATFTIFGVTIGGDFHWERREDQSFPGDLLLRARIDGTLAIVNRVHVEQYLQSVVSSEMRPSAPREFLRIHAILSRSWLLSLLERRNTPTGRRGQTEGAVDKPSEVIRWYGGEDHDLYDVCADDHCQRYHGLGKITCAGPEEAVAETRGAVITCGGDICDARYSKACGGLTEEYSSAWDDVDVPYLVSVSDAEMTYCPVASEEDANRWMLTTPSAYCQTTDGDLLSQVLPDFDRETNDFFRWTVRYAVGELTEIVRERSGLDLGEVQKLVPLQRGPSGRIRRLKIEGSKGSVIVGKELEIRRWLSRTHLYSSAFVVETHMGRGGRAESFTLRGAGWGHGVGLCQIGAAVMASRGFSAPEILGHYFTGVRIEKVY
jgi:stage II sporulation protein D